MKIISTLFMLLFLNFSFAQQYELKSQTQNSESVTKLTSSGYSGLLNREMHATFNLDIKLDDNFLLELQGYYDTYLLSDVFELALREKWYLSDRFYFFSGVGVEKDLNKYGGESALPSFKLKNGFGYDVNKNIMIEAKHDLHFNKTNLGNYATPNLFSLSGKYRF